MEAGESIDIMTGRPESEVKGLKKQLKDQKKEADLREQAEFINVTLSPESRKLIDLIVKKLEKRIETLITNDPEASAYKKILKDVKYREDLAKKAIDIIYQRQLD